VTTGGLTTLHRELISALALRHKLPAVYPADYFGRRSGLLRRPPARSDRRHNGSVVAAVADAGEDRHAVVLFDHFGSGGYQSGWHRETKRFGCPED
jgi:hypothetical protein